MGISVFRENKIKALIERDGDGCHYCGCHVRINYIGPIRDRDHATLDHKIPRSKGGTAHLDNLVLACNECNNAKADRSYDEFKEAPYRLGVVLQPQKLKKRNIVHPAYKARKGTLAAAINSGEVTEYGMYRGTPPSQLKSEPKGRIEPVPYHETMYILTGKRVPKREAFFDRR